MKQATLPRDRMIEIGNGWMRGKKPVLFFYGRENERIEWFCTKRFHYWEEMKVQSCQGNE